MECNHIWRKVEEGFACVNCGKLIKSIVGEGKLHWQSDMKWVKDDRIRYYKKPGARDKKL